MAALFLCAPLFASAGGIEQLRAFVAATQSLSGQFEQSVRGANRAKTQRSSGSFALQRPGKFRWAYALPYPQLLVSDGERLWAWDPDLKQATQRKIGAALDATPAALLVGGDLDKYFVLRNTDSMDGMEVVEAEPKDAESSFAKIRIGFSNQLPRSMEIRDRFGQVTTLTFSALRANPRLPASEFRFTPPAGADVVESN